MGGVGVRIRRFEYRQGMKGLVEGFADLGLQLSSLALSQPEI